MPLIAEGQCIRDTYVVERFLGEGAFAEVYRVTHRFLGRQAMKVFKRQGITLAEIEHMLSEAVLLSQIGHPNVVRVFDANTLQCGEDVHGYFTMENVAGGSLDRFWRSHGNKLIQIDTVVEIAQQACRGLTIAHEATPPIVHRDVKPQNILVGYDPAGLRVRISDFGLAKSVNPLTLLATSAGTFVFKPPEAFRDRQGDSCAADVWAMGVTLYLLLTDHLPYDIDPDLGWSNHAAFQHSPPAPSVFNPSVNRTLDEIVATCMEPDPVDRYPDARALLEALETWRETTNKKHVAASIDTVSSHPKDQCGTISPLDQKYAEELVGKAFIQARTFGKAMDAADLMEEAFNRSPNLRAKYAEQVRLWRCGVIM